MANNRMWIECTICSSEDGRLQVYSDKEKIRIATFYPYSGWYLSEYIAKNERFENWFEEHEHGVQDSVGATHFTLTFEDSQPLPQEK